MNVENNERTLVIGDIHGNYKCMRQALERANYDDTRDLLISLGDLTDGYEESFEVIQFLLEQNKVISVVGNHDIFVRDWLESDGRHVSNHWLQNRGASTLKSFSENNLTTKNPLFKTFRHFFRNQKNFYELGNKLFVHGGISPITKRADEIDNADIFCWDRDMWNTAFEAKTEDKAVETKNTCFEYYSTIFIGHTPTYNSVQNNIDPDANPVKALNVINLDTGGGWNGKVTVMDISTQEYWQSDFRTRKGVY